MRAHMMFSRRVVLSAAMLLGTRALSAQLASASAVGFGMAGNYMAMSRGYEAIALNPANLAMPGRPFMSLGTGIIGGTVGMDPVGFGMLHEHSGVVVDSAIRASWVDLVKTSGRQRARIDGGITPLALTIGPIGIATGVSTYTNMDLSPDAFEAVMFGNAGNNNGQAKPLTFTGTGVETGVFVTGAASFALPLPLHVTNGLLGPENFAIGLTGKYTAGALVLAKDGGSVFGTNSVTYSFPMVLPSDSTKLPGKGFGADISAAWQAGRWKAALQVENVFNSFKWDSSAFSYQSATGYFDKDSSTSSDTTLAFAQAPQALKDIVLAQGFKPAINLGVAFKPVDFLTITADYHQQMGGDDAISIGPKNRLGVGAELRILPFIPLRAGIASVTDGWQAGGGLGIRLLGFELGVSGSLRKRGEATESGFMISVIGMGH